MISEIIGYILTYPLKLLLGIFVRLFGFKKEYLQLKKDFFASPTKDLKAKYRFAKENKVIDPWVLGGDAPKFLGLYAEAFPSPENARMLLEFVDENGFTRKVSSLAFSEDMYAGWIAGFVANFKYLTKSEIEKVKNAIECCLFENKFTFSDPKKADRGYIFRWWHFPWHAILTHSVIDLYFALSEKPKKKWLLYLIKAITYPFLYLCPGGILLWKKMSFFHPWWIHSQAAISYAMYRLTGKKKYKDYLNQLYEIFGYFNPDIQVWWGLVFKKMPEDLRMWLDDFYETKEIEFSYQVELDLPKLVREREVIWVKRTCEVVPPHAWKEVYRFDKWPNHPEWGSFDSHIDFLHLYKLYTKLLDVVKSTNN